MEKKTELLKLYQKGKLGTFPIAMNRVRAGLMLMKDYRFSLFSVRTTRAYDSMPSGSKNGYADAAVSRQDAADRYLGAIKAVGEYRIYALHFLRDDLNIRDFILKNPVLNNGSKTTYKMIYKALCETLDRLVVYYDRLQMAKVG